MGLDFFAASKFVNCQRVDPIDTVRSEFKLYFKSITEIWNIWHVDPRSIFRELMEIDEEDLAGRFYGNLPGARHYHSAEALVDMPHDIPVEFLPPVISPDEALSLADDIAHLDYEAVERVVAYLRFWGSRGHPIHCSY